MKYKVGSKVKYDGGDWWFYGTITAVFEHSISPCYRVSVERMEKKSCKFSITQFEFELELCHEVVDSGKDKRKWENSEIELLNKYYGVLDMSDLSKMLNRSPQSIEDKWDTTKPEQIQATETSPVTAAVEPEKKTRKKRISKKEKELNLETVPENVETAQAPKAEKTKRIRRRDAWYQNYEMYRKGEKSNVISTWIAQNRREYKIGKLKEGKYEKLMEIGFPFDAIKKKNDNWDNHLEEWKRGDRRTTVVQQWKQRSVKQYLENKLSIDRIAKLKEVGILK